MESTELKRLLALPAGPDLDREVCERLGIPQDQIQTMTETIPCGHPAVSTDWGAMRLVVDPVKNVGFELYWTGDSWAAMINGLKDTYCGYGLDAPLAVCRMRLRAIMGGE